MGKGASTPTEDTGHVKCPLTGPDPLLTDRKRTRTEQKQNRTESETTVHTNIRQNADNSWVF